MTAMNDPCPMTKDEGNPNVPIPNTEKRTCFHERDSRMIYPSRALGFSSFGFRSSFVIRHSSLFFLAWLFLGLNVSRSAEAILRPEKLAEMDAAIEQAIADGKCPGGVLWFEHQGTSYHKAFGHRALVPERESMTEDTIFDAASLTKVVACTPAIMLLVERGSVKLDDPVHAYIPEFKGDGKEAITVRQ